MSEVEHAAKMFVLDDSLPERLNELATEGWTLIQSVPPVGIYHVCRVKGDQGQKPVARISIDESKVFLHRDGKLIDKDGNIVDPAVLGL